MVESLCYYVVKCAFYFFLEHFQFATIEYKFHAQSTRYEDACTFSFVRHYCRVVNVTCNTVSFNKSFVGELVNVEHALYELRSSSRRSSCDRRKS